MPRVKDMYAHIEMDNHRTPDNNWRWTHPELVTTLNTQAEWIQDLRDSLKAITMRLERLESGHDE